MTQQKQFTDIYSICTRKRQYVSFTLLALSAVWMIRGVFFTNIDHHTNDCIMFYIRCYKVFIFIQVTLCQQISLAKIRKFWKLDLHTH